MNRAIELQQLCVSLIGDSYLTLEETDKIGAYTRKKNLIYDPHYLTYILDVFKIEEYQVFSKTRIREVVHARFMCYWYLYNSTNLTLGSIGKMFNRDHATVLHGLKKDREWTDIKDPIHLRLKEEFNSKIEKI